MKLTTASAVVLPLLVLACSSASEGPGSAPHDEALATTSEALTDATTWQQGGATSQRANVNGYDTAISRANVSSLVASWNVSATYPTNAAVVGGRAYTGSSSGMVRVVDVATGNLVWSRQLPAGAYVSPAVAYGRVYVTAGKYLFALSTSAGSLIFRVLHSADVSASSPLVADGKVFVRDAAGKIFAYDAKATSTVTALFDFDASASADPSAANGVVYVPSTDERIYAYSSAGCAGTCAPLWSTAPLGGVAWFPPAVWPPRVLVTTMSDTTTAVQAVDAANGGSLWSTTLTGATDATGVAIGYGKAYVSLGGVDELWSLSLSTGALVWKAPLAADPTDTPAVANELVYAPSGRSIGYLEVFDSTCASGGGTCSHATVFGSDPYAYSPSIASGMVFVSAATKTTAFTVP